MISQLASLCRTGPACAKWVIVPNHSLGNALAERLARSGVNWANVRFVTPFDLAVRMAGPYVVDARTDPTEDTLGPALVMRLLLALPEEGGYFRPMADQPSMANALWRTLSELRLAGVEASGLPAAPFVSGHKHAELTRLLAAYERQLAEHRMADAATLYARAPDYPQFCPIGADDLRIEWPGVAWAPLVRRFIDGLPGQPVAPAGWELPGAPTPRRVPALAASGAVKNRDVNAPGERAPVASGATGALRDSARLRFLMSPGAAPERVGPEDGSLQFFTAGGRDAEIDEVCRRVLASGLPLDEVEIACAGETHALLAWEKAIRLDWPLTTACGVPASVTRPGRVLLAWCSWIDLDFAATRLRRLLQSGDVAPAPFAAETDGEGRLSAGQAARLLLRAAPTWGRETYGAAFARLREHYQARAEDPERDDTQRASDATMLRRVERVGAWCAASVSRVPVPDAAGAIDVPALVGAAREFLASNAARTSALDAAALTELDDSLAELLSLGAFRTPVQTALRFLRERLEGLRVGADRARPGHLHVSRLHAAGLAGRSLVFVVGLEEGRVFPASTEDPILLDDERSGIHPLLARSGDRLAESVHASVTALARVGADAARGVCLSYSRRDTREFRETFPSWIVLQAFRVLKGDATLGFGDLDDFLGEPASAVPRSAADATHEPGWWMAQARRAPTVVEAGVLATFPALARGRAALESRASDAFTAWDGFVPAAGAALDISSGRHVMSASTLEDAAECPFRFFLERALRVEPLEESEPQPDVWLDHLTRGRELHAIFAEIMREARDRGGRPTHDVVDRAVTLAACRLEALARDMPPPSPEVHARESEEFLNDVRLFVEEECNRPDTEPIAFEVSFGFPLGVDNVEPLAMAEPVEIVLGHGRVLRIRGRIDRIDRRRDETFETIDYKTGQFYGPRWEGTFARGTRLQHALYGVAAERMLSQRYERPAVSRGTYYFPSTRGFQQTKPIETPSPATLKEVLGDLAGVIASGTFVHAPEKEACSFCAFANACGRDPHERAARKTEQAPELERYRRLRQHE